MTEQLHRVLRVMAIVATTFLAADLAASVLRSPAPLASVSLAATARLGQPLTAEAPSATPVSELGRFIVTPDTLRHLPPAQESFK